MKVAWLQQVCRQNSTRSTARAQRVLHAIYRRRHNTNKIDTRYYKIATTLYGIIFVLTNVTRTPGVRVVYYEGRNGPGVTSRTSSDRGMFTWTI